MQVKPFLPEYPQVRAVFAGAPEPVPSPPPERSWRGAGGGSGSVSPTTAP
jgi:hypothetical protein